MTTDHRENVMKPNPTRKGAARDCKRYRREKGRRAVGQKEITRLRKQQELLTLLKRLFKMKARDSRCGPTGANRGFRPPRI